MIDALITYGTCAVIIAFAVWFWYLTKTAKSETLVRRERTYDAFPSIVSTLGVLGTFFGITYGLYFFDVNDLTTSVPKLLEGLKTAFFTSLCGMVGSLLLRHFVTDKKYEAADVVTSDTKAAQIEICNAMVTMKNSVVAAMQSNEREVKALAASQLANDSTKIALLNSIVEGINSTKLNGDQLKVVVGNMQTLVTSLGQSTNSIAANIEDIDTRVSVIVGNVNEISQNLESQGATLSSIDNVGKLSASETKQANSRIGELLDIEEGNATTIQSTLDETKKFSEVLRGEVDEIEQKMTETNALLTRKFDEFSELLKKSNTEALVEVMKKVTEEFQKQMNALISKLIQENFDQLNNSVEKLNQWQQENKEMITSLTQQYRQMANDFEGSSTVLAKVSEDTRQLTGDGSKLQTIIDELKKVMVDDKKFTEISTKLESTATLTKSNMEAFDESTHKLNDWVKKQRDFNKGVETLITKLDELNKIRNYGEEFWQDTKKSLNEGVGYIKEGTKQLNSQLTELDKRFYSRLGSTLSELDKCISAMVDKQ